MFSLLFFQWPQWIMVIPEACAEAYSEPEDKTNTGDCGVTAKRHRSKETCTKR
jgi:hypothetical protein